MVQVQLTLHPDNYVFLSFLDCFGVDSFKPLVEKIEGTEEPVATLYRK